MLLLGVSIAGGATASAEQEETSSGRWAIRSERPADGWTDAFVTGNGWQGTMVMGAPGNERIICVHEELFIRGWDREKKAVADIAHLLPEVRRVIEAGKPQEAYKIADKEARKQLVEMGAPQIWPLVPHPAFDLKVDLDSSGKPSGYQRKLDLENGEALSQWQDEKGGVEQRVFSSRTHNVNVVQLRATGGRKLDVTLCLAETPGRKGNHMGHNLDRAFMSVRSEAASGWLYYHADYATDHGGYEGVARVTTKGGKMSKVGNKLRVTDTDEALVALRINPLDDGSASQRAALQEEMAKLPAQYEELLAPHARKHGEMFRRVTLDLGCEKQWDAMPTEKLLTLSSSKGITPLFLEQAYAMGRYLLISTSGKYPAPLQGIWGGSWKPAWIGGFVLDSNLNLAISAASMGNLPECAESYFGYVERILPGWRLNARKYLGCRGFLVPNYSDPEKGYLNHFTGMYAWMYWPGGAGWNIRPFYDYALLTGDQNFMKKRVLPLYLEMADFYEDYLVKGEDGRYHITPSISPENWPLNFGRTMVVKDSAFDIAVAREVFQILIEMGETFKLDPKNIAKWKQYRDRLVAYRINKDGALAEWAPKDYQDNYKHRHNSHLYPIFPGMEFLGPHADPALLKAAHVALNKRFVHDTDSAHGLIHVALMAARLHDVKKVRTNLDRFSRRRYVYASFVTSHNPNHSIYNLDASMSMPRLLMEMLVFSRPGHIELLPAWPKDYPDGSIQGVLIRGGHKIDISWTGGKLKTATLHAGHDDHCIVKYGNVTQSLELKAAQTYRFDGQLQVSGLMPNH
jgi:hypothetical protein